VVGGRLKNRNSRPVVREIVAPDLGTLHHGVPIEGGQHLMTAVRQRSESMVVPTAVLGLAMARAHDPSKVPEAPGRSAFAKQAEPAQALRGLDPKTLRAVALVGGAGDLAELLPRALRKMLDITELRAEAIANALGGAKGAAHLLRLIATNETGALIGGYSIVVV
jgi:hypothetical protein